MCSSLLPVLVGISMVTQVSEQTPGWFRFPMSPIESLAGTPVDASFLNSGPAASRISVQTDHFVDEQGNRVRLIGTNVCFSNAFPEKPDATRIADRMAQLGFNVVRFHHMDARDIWLPGQEGLDPEKLDRLHWFIAELKRNGIYTNLNLHVSRTYPGLQEMTSERAFRYGKIVDNFHDPYIDLQEQYARDLLTQVNPYTGLKPSEDPAVAFVELNNENTLLNLSQTALAVMPQPLRESLAAKWRTWLAGRYASLAELKQTWNGELIPLGEEMLVNRDFRKGTEGWGVQGLKANACNVSAAEDDDRPVLRVEMVQKGSVPWAYQVHQMDMKYQEGMVYTVRFRGRAVPARRVSVSLRFAEAPWTIVSRSANVDLTPEWQEFSFVTPVGGVRDDLKQRFSFNLGDAVGQVELADVSLRPGSVPFDPGKEIAAIADLPLPQDLWPARAWADFRRFLIDTERDYVSRMKSYLVDTLGVKSLVIDTQASYGGFSGLHREATLSDYIDMHAYWQHPRFPGKPWDSGNWTIENTSMAAAPPGRSTFERLSAYRLAGRPFSVSEYNHPAPNDHAAELFPMLAAYASHQDWDALYQFCYGNSVHTFKEPKIAGYFTLGSHSGQLVFAPIASIIFRQGLIPPAAATSLLRIPEAALDNNLAEGYLSSGKLASEGILTPESQIESRFSVEFVKDGDAPSLETVPSERPAAVSWQRSENEPCRFLANADAARIAVGEIGGQALDLGDLQVTVRPSEGAWAAFALAAADGQPLAESKHALLALVTRVENTNMGWSEDRRTVGRKWGSAPLVAQGVAADLVLPGDDKPRVIALDSQGRPIGDVPVTGQPGRWTVGLGPQYNTLWYAVER